MSTSGLHTHVHTPLHSIHPCTHMYHTHVSTHTHIPYIYTYAKKFIIMVTPKKLWLLLKKVI